VERGTDAVRPRSQDDASGRGALVATADSIGPSANHDPDGDSNGTTISVNKPA